MTAAGVFGPVSDEVLDAVLPVATTAVTALVAGGQMAEASGVALLLGLLAGPPSASDTLADMMRRGAALLRAHHEVSS